MDKVQDSTADEAAYQALATEVGDTQEPSPAKPEPAPAAEDTKDAPAEEAKQPERLPYEEIEKRYKNLNGALAQTRAEAREAKQQIENMRQLFSSLQTQRQQPVIDDVPADPLEREVITLRQQMQELAAFKAQAEARAQEERALHAATSQMSAAEKAFSAEAPDYYDAVDHLRDVREAELSVIYPDDDPEVINAARRAGFQTPADLRAEMMRREAFMLTQQAIRAGRNPAQMFYQIAKQRGFAPAPPAPAASAPPAKRIETIRKAQGSPTSLSGGVSAPSKDVEGLPSMEELADMYITDPKKADSVFKKMKAAGLLG